MPPPLRMEGRVGEGLSGHCECRRASSARLRFRASPLGAPRPRTPPQPTGPRAQHAGALRAASQWLASGPHRPLQAGEGAKSNAHSGEQILAPLSSRRMLASLLRRDPPPPLDAVRPFALADGSVVPVRWVRDARARRLRLLVTERGVRLT